MQLIRNLLPMLSLVGQPRKAELVATDNGLSRVHRYSYGLDRGVEHPPLDIVVNEVLPIRHSSQTMIPFSVSSILVPASSFGPF